MGRQILETNNYGKFKLAPFNRDLGNTKSLEESMKKYGFLEGFPLLVKRNGQGKFVILAGHHRFHVAKKLGIPVKYVETKVEINIPELEKATISWNIQNYLESYCREERRAYLRVREYHEETGITLNACISLLAGDSAGSGNHSKIFKAGNYKLGNPAHAALVGDIVLHLRKIGVSWATNQYLVAAISKIVWVKECDTSIMKNKMSTYRQFIQKQPSKQNYLEMLDAIYNRGSHTKIPLAFLADEMAKQRGPNINKKTPR